MQQILRLRTRQRHHQQQQAGNGTGVGNAHGTNQPSTNNENANNPNNNGQPNDGGANAPPTNRININNNNNNNINNNNNNNNTIFNANRNVVIHIGNFFNQHMPATLIISRALNIVGAMRNVIANDIFGVAAIFNNNNDNNLNNNNAAGTATSHIRINLTNLRRINLSGIQINPVERNDDRLDGNGGVGTGGGGVGSGGGVATENNIAANENRTGDQSNGNDIDGDVQYDGAVDPTDECDNLLKKCAQSEGELSQYQLSSDQVKILDLNDVSEKDGDITFTSVVDESPTAPTDVLIDNEIQAPNCHGDPDSINVSIAQFNEKLNTDDGQGDANVVVNQSISVDHDNAASVVNASNHRNEMEQCVGAADVAVHDDKNSDAYPNIGAPTIASIGKFDSITDECNLHSRTGDMVNDSGDRSVANNDKECTTDCAIGNDSRRKSSTSGSSSNCNKSNADEDGNNSNISDSSKDSSGNRLPIVSPFK